MSDLIDRQAAIDALGERPMSWTDSDYELGQRNQYDLDKAHLELVPSAQPERKGKWIEKPRFTEFGGKPCKDKQPDLQCQFCGETIGWWDARNFCPNCGADMREPEE